MAILPWVTLGLWGLLFGACTLLFVDARAQRWAAAV